jgi:hypothetical protein
LFPCIEWGNEQMAKQNGLDSLDYKSIDFNFQEHLRGEKRKKNKRVVA